MNFEITLTIHEPNDEMKSLLEELMPYCTDKREVRSAIGIAEITLIILAGEFLVSLASLPLLYNSIENKKVTIKAKGFEMKDSPKKIVKTLIDMPDIREEVTKAYKNRSLMMQGNAKSISKLRKQLKELVDNV